MTPADTSRRRRSTPLLLWVTMLAGVILCSFIPPVSAAPTSPSPTPSSAARPRSQKAATFGIGPADSKELDGRPFLTYLASPGARLTDHVALVNLATKKVTLNVYAVDAEIGTDGSFGYVAKAAPRRDASTWITPITPTHRPTITVAPRSTVILPIVIVIPANASPGDHAAGVITSLTSKVVTDQGERIDFEQRVALRAFVRVSGPLHPRLAIEHLRARYRGTANPIGGGTVTVSYTVHNTGNVRLGAQQQVMISGLFGTTRPAQALADVPLLLPDSAMNMSVTVRGVLAQVSMRARVVLAPLSVPGDVNPGVPTRITATSTFWAIPWALIALVAALLVCVLGLWAWRRQRRRPPAAPPSGRHREKPVTPDDGGEYSDPVAVPKPEGARA